MSGGGYISRARYVPCQGLGGLTGARDGEGVLLGLGGFAAGVLVASLRARLLRLAAAPPTIARFTVELRSGAIRPLVALVSLLHDAVDLGDGLAARLAVLDHQRGCAECRTRQIVGALTLPSFELVGRLVDAGGLGGQRDPLFERVALVIGERRLEGVDDDFCEDLDLVEVLDALDDAVGLLDREVELTE